MTEIRIFKPENNNDPIIIFEQDLLDFILNMKFGDYTVRYGSDTVRTRLTSQDFGEYEIREDQYDEEEHQGINNSDDHRPDCECCGSIMIKIPRLVVKNHDTNEILFNSPITDNWLLEVKIREILKSKYNIKVMICNMGGAEECEICENNTYGFDLDSIVDRYSMDYHSFPMGDYMEHPPDPHEPIDEKVLEDMK
jgi:hypothetical protein